MSALRAALEGGWHLVPTATYQWRKAQLDLGGIDAETGDIRLRVDNGTGELADLTPTHALQLAALLVEYAAGQAPELSTARDALIAVHETVTTVGDLW